MDALKIQSFNSANIFYDLQPEWNNLLKRSITDTPFTTYEWHSNWWNTYHPGELWIVTIRDNENTLHGIASLFNVEEDGKRVVHFVGCEDVTDYGDVIVSADQADAVYNALATELLDKQDKYDLIDWCNIPSASPTYTDFPQQLSDKGFSVETTRQEVCPLINLPASFEVYLDSLDKKQSKEVQRKLRRAKGAGDSLNWYIVDEEHDIDAEVDKFIELMAASHPEKAQFLEDEQNVAFMRSIIPVASKAGWLQMNFLEVMNEPVAAYVNFDYNNQILVYNSGLEPRKAAALSPGIILLAYNIEHAIENKRSVLNFLRGDEQYKYKMGGQDTEIFNLKASL